ncbi:MAG TPA: stage V sporulation protein SpoVM [Candidatus Anaerofilum excrementigallinarum]|nr:stage V sporulation protein SpoVM [Candidatus Anaerofilum excrementigallinarum]
MAGFPAKGNPFAPVCIQYNQKGRPGQTGSGWKGRHGAMQIVVVKSPRFLAGILRRVFGIGKSV